MSFGKRLSAIIIAVMTLCNIAYASADDDIAIETSEVTAKYQTGGAIIYASGKAGINATNWLEFQPDIPTGGQYEVWINAASVSNATAELYINASPVDGQPLSGATAQASAVVNTGDWNTFSDFQLGTVELEQGTQSLCFACKSAGYTLWHIVLKPVIPEFKLLRVTANGTEFNSGAEIFRGTDTFSAEFSTAIDADSLSNAEIQVSNGTETVPAEVEIDGKKLNIILKSTLQYETDYTLSIKNIKGELADWDLGEKTLSFTTSDSSSDVGRGVLSDITQSLQSGRAVISGTISAQRAIKGRKISTHIVLPSNDEISLSDVYSGDDGKFTVEYPFSQDSADGVYKFYLTPEYASDSECVQIEYNPYINNHMLFASKECSAYYPENMPFWSSGAASVNTTNWLEFDVDVETEGEYTAKINAAATGQAMVTFSVDDTEAMSAMFPKTGDDYQTYQNVNMGKIQLSAGTYKVRITVASGAISMKSWELMCITESQMNMLLATLKTTKTAHEVQGWFEKNGELLEFDVSNDLRQFADKDNFYRHFIGMEVDSLDSIKDCYAKFIIFEGFNQGDAAAKREILENADSCAKLGLDNTLLEIFASHKDEFITEISETADYENIEQLSANYDELCEKYIREAYKEDISLTVQDVSTYIGREVNIPLRINTPLKSVSEIKLEINAGEDLLKSMKFTVGEVKGRMTDGTFTLSFDTPHSIDNILGELSITSAKVTDSKISLQGTVTIKVVCGSKTIEITNNILPCNASVKVLRNSSNSTYSGGSLGGGGVSVPNTPKPEDKPAITPVIDTFVDIDSVEWARESIENLCKRGIIAMNEEKTFSPNRNITREEFVKMIVMAMGILDNSAQSDFADIKADEWSYPYVSSAVKYGIVTGKQDGSFGLGEEITRQDMAAILARTMQKAGFAFDGYDELFADHADIADYARDGVYAMRQYGIINGVGDNQFAPLMNATRAMAAKMIYEMIKVVE